MHRSCAARVTLSTSSPRPINADGEIRAETPAEFSVVREGLTVVVPKTLPQGHRGLVGLA
jgi:diacylglycerol kinase family enzyme